MPIIRHTSPPESSEILPVSYESRVKHFVDAYSSSSPSSSTSETNSVKLSVAESKFTLINYHQPQSKFSTSSSALSYLNEVEIPARLKRSSSFRSNTRRLPQVVINKQEVTSAEKVQMTDSGFMSSFNSLSSSSNSASPPLLNTSGLKPNCASPVSSSSSSSPTSMSKNLSDDSSKQTNVKSIAKSYETNSTVILPNYFKPKLGANNEKQSNSIIKIINNNTENSKLIRTKFDSFEMPSKREETCDATKTHEIGQQSITSFNVNEIVLDTTAQSQQQASPPINGYIISKIQNETTKESGQLITATPSTTNTTTSPPILTKQKLVKLNMSDLDKPTKQSQSSTPTVPQSSNTNSSSSSFHKVLNRLVETGMQVTKTASSLSTTTSFSKPPILKKQNNSYNTNFEPIIGYDDQDQQQKQQTEVTSSNSKLKKKSSYSYKSNSLTRQSKQANDNKKNLFKLNEFESINISGENAKSATKADKTLSFFNNFNNKDDKLSKLGKSSKGYTISSSLPSRNLGNKVVDDIKSLFDKFTHHSSSSSSKNSTQSKSKQAEQDESNTETPSQPGTAFHDGSKLTTFKNSEQAKLKLSQSFNSSSNDLLQVKSLLNKDQHMVTECPDSPRKGALKKLNGSRDSSATRSPLKVRWKDMIEITDLVEDNDNESYSSDDSLNYHSDNENANTNGHDTDDENYHNPDGDAVKKTKKKKLKKKNSTAKLNDDSFDIIITSEKKLHGNRKFEGKQQQINLKPLHSTGKQFELEMTERLNRLNQIKTKTNVDSTNNEKFYDEIHADLDVVLYELHSTIEHVRLSSMISNVNQTDESENSSNASSESNESDVKIEEKISSVAQICRQFVNNSKNMISSALVNESEVKPFVRSAMNSLCSLVVQCLETNYDYLNKNKKLDETRQLLIQILNLLNTFRTTLNITYLASSKQLNEGNMNLLMKQATNLANEISLLIKHFKLLF